MKIIIIKREFFFNEQTTVKLDIEVGWFRISTSPVREQYKKQQKEYDESYKEFLPPLSPENWVTSRIKHQKRGSSNEYHFEILKKVFSSELTTKVVLSKSFESCVIEKIAWLELFLILFLWKRAERRKKRRDNLLEQMQKLRTWSLGIPHNFTYPATRTRINWNSCRRAFFRAMMGRVEFIIVQSFRFIRREYKIHDFPWQCRKKSFGLNNIPPPSYLNVIMWLDLDRRLPPETKCVIMMMKLSCPPRLNSSPCCKIWSEFSPSTLCHYRTQLLRKVVSWLDDSGVFSKQCELGWREICHISTWIIWWWLGHFSEKWKKWKLRLFNFSWCSWRALINSSAKHDPCNFSDINFFLFFCEFISYSTTVAAKPKYANGKKKFRQNQRARRQASTVNVITRFNWNQRRLCLGINE